MNPKTFETWYKEKEVEFARNTLAGHFDRCDVVDAREYAAIQKDVARTVLHNLLDIAAAHLCAEPADDSAVRTQLWCQGGAVGDSIHVESN